MITSELREYCEGVISYYSAEYPYYFMCTNTTVTNTSYSQTGATIYFSKTVPTVISQVSMKSDHWLVVTVKSANANNNDHTARVTTSSRSGTVSCNLYEYVYSNVESTYAYSSVSVHSNAPIAEKEAVDQFGLIFVGAMLLALVVAIWIRR